MKMNEDITESIKAEGELSKTQVDMLKRDNVDYGSINERIIRLMPDSLAGFLHKFPRDYRMTVMRNYFLHRLTRPTIGNSLSARMRPYEPEFVTNKEMGRLEKEDNIFFLGDNYRDMQIDASGIGGPSRTTLGKFWRTFELSFSLLIYWIDVGFCQSRSRKAFPSVFLFNSLTNSRVYP